MAIGDNENSEEDNLTYLSGFSDLNLEEESKDEIEFDLGNMLWSDEIPEDTICNHPQFTGDPRGPVQPVSTLLECIQLYLKFRSNPVYSPDCSENLAFMYCSTHSGSFCL